jgi:hypothetical protein
MRGYGSRERLTASLKLVGGAGAALSMLAACDPAGPGVSGTIRLGTDARPAAFATLQIRAYPDPGGPFDPTNLPSHALSDAELSSVAFPFAYDVFDPLGTASSPNWRLVAWLSHHPGSDGLSVVPEDGDVYCTAPVTIASCGGFGGYCGVTSGVDCTLGASVP